MTISILIVSYKSRELLRQCLKGVLRYPPQASYEIVVVDNGSADGTADMVRRDFPAVTLLALPKNIGYARGTNLGIRRTAGEYILFMNADVVVPVGSLDALVGYLTAHPKVGVVGPQLLNPDRTVQHTAFRWHRILTPLCRRTLLKNTGWGRAELRRFLMLDWNHASERPVDWLMSSCMLVRREALNQVGVFDERFFVYFADTDLCRRLWRGGWSVVYTPVTSFTHYYRRESAEDLWLTAIHVRDWFRYLWKWRGEPSVSYGP